MVARPTRTAPKVAGPAPATRPRPRFRATDARYWGYLTITRAGCFERHIRSCPGCRPAQGWAAGSSWCTTAWTLAARTDEAADHLRQLTEYAEEHPIPSGMAW